MSREVHVRFCERLGGRVPLAYVKSVRVIAKDTVHGLSTKVAQLELSSKAVKKITLELEKKID